MAPTLSQLESWDTDHLINAATYWTTTANKWEDTFAQVRIQSQTMGWDGQGGDALRARTGADLTSVTTQADQLRNAAQVARTGASNISAAQRQALYAVEDAQNAGFQVGEDLSVTDTRSSGSAAEQAARQAQAQTFAANINQRAAQLLGVETETSGQLTTAAGSVGAMNFAGAPKSGAAATNPGGGAVNGPRYENPVTTSPANGKPNIRLVDNLTGPPDPANPTPGAEQPGSYTHLRAHETVLDLVWSVVRRSDRWDAAPNNPPRRSGHSRCPRKLLRRCHQGRLRRRVPPIRPADY
ncbi:transmembrane protein [Mycobacterium numidiamassiliense]|uniref:Transmembrane protein n=1 Tax=Mycobacterium numidiamassiliense TaxID=1841861 RepID=A0A2U3PIN2_9MYCO|nr:hypothetical protein [Mycobacterium numidiamassiliense]SPM43627.1 transmembrane protein [Mycobacterium numidiamassiliense]